MLLEGVDLLNSLARVPTRALTHGRPLNENRSKYFLHRWPCLPTRPTRQQRALVKPPKRPASSTRTWRSLLGKAFRTEPVQTEKPVLDRTLRITADNLNRMMGLAGEAQAAARWVESFSRDLMRVKQLQQQLGKTVEGIQELQVPTTAERHENGPWSELLEQISAGHRLLAARLADLDQFDRRFMNFSTRLYHEVLDCRMRPFADGIQGFQRMVRDVARHLGKKVRLDIQGEATLVDRDILERLKAPLDHLLRNAIDHGIESPTERKHRGKPEEGTLELSARHSAGMLLITLTDDGRGIDPESLRAAVVRKNLTTLDATQKMDAAELLDFLFLPGFTLKESVSEISGRGVGLDAVQAMAKEVGGVVRVSSEFHTGTTFQLELPLTLSVVRTLLVEIAGEPFALPLSRIDRALKISRSKIGVVQGRQHFAMEDHQVGLATGHQVLGLRNTSAASEEASVIVFGNKVDLYGLVVDRFLGERELVVRPLDPRLGKVKNVSSAALMPDGSPVFILDVDDLKRSIENIASGDDRLESVGEQTGQSPAARRKRVLVIDDSLTVRELERKLLVSQGIRGGCGHRWHAWLERGSNRELRSDDHRHRHASIGRYRIAQAGPSG